MVFKNKIAEDIFKLRYALHPEETWEEASLRVSGHVAKAENDIKKWTEEFYSTLAPADFVPGGRFWYSCGRKVAQILNCFVIPAEDSREGWGKAVAENIIIAGMSGGNGENYSTIRYRGAPIHGTGGIASGAVSLMRIENAALEEVKDGGSRRAARMACLNIGHPDILEFLDAKLDKKQLNNMNISVVFDDDPEIFFNAVREDLDWDLRWNNQVIRTVKAKDLWKRIVKNALENGEPGVLNGYYANKMSNLCGVRTLVSTNPCGEIWLEPYGCCCLGSLNLPNFIKLESKAKDIRDHIDWKKLHKTVSLAVRLLDDALDVNDYPLPAIREESLNTRRVGLGYMGVHHFLLELGFRYSSEEARDFMDKIGSFVKHAAYDTSIALAIEKGVFPLYSDKVLESGFIKGLKPSFQSKIEQFGLRNCALLNCPPTGTTSIAVGTSSAFEPIFGLGWKRKYKQNDEIVTEVVVDPLYEKFVAEGRDTSHFEGASDIDPEDHLKMQVVIQKHCDNAVSKTINLPPGKHSEERLSELYMKYLPELKGITVYPEGSREDSPLTRISDEQARAYIEQNIAFQGLISECPTGTCDI